MHTIFVVGTAGSGKSLLTLNLAEWYKSKGAHSITVNLDPGALNLPYEPDVDVREYIDLQQVMEIYGLGPNGAMILSCDLIATKLSELQEDIDELTPDYAIIDTPGQMELFAYRESGPFILKNIRADSKAVLFLFDGVLVSNPVNLVSMMLLATSVQLRLASPQIPVLTKKDLVKNVRDVVEWSSNPTALEAAVYSSSPSIESLLSRGILKSVVRLGFGYNLIPVSSVTLDGMLNLAAALSRILRAGEEVED
ncbi:MAG: ATP/GTP-binding protein [Nitrososphaerales archaeon]